MITWLAICEIGSFLSHLYEICVCLTQVCVSHTWKLDSILSHIKYNEQKNTRQTFFSCDGLLAQLLLVQVSHLNQTSHVSYPGLTSFSRQQWTKSLSIVFFAFQYFKNYSGFIKSITVRLDSSECGKLVISYHAQKFSGKWDGKKEAPKRCPGSRC